MGRHAGKIALCAGSATGMGAESAFRLAMEGAKVVVGDVNLPAAEALAARIGAAGGEAMAKAFDLAEEASVAALFDAAVGRFGGLDLLHVNGADLVTGLRDFDALNTDLAVFDRMLATGLRGHLLCTRAAVPLMQQRGGGAIVYTSSIAARTASPVNFSYFIMKAGLNALMRHVAMRWGAEGVRANAICPGVVRTEWIMKLLSQAQLAGAASRVPSPRLGEPQDIAALVSFLLSDEAEWLNGQAIGIDGGASLNG